MSGGIIADNPGLATIRLISAEGLVRACRQKSGSAHFPLLVVSSLTGKHGSSNVCSHFRGDGHKRFVERDSRIVQNMPLHDVNASIESSVSSLGMFSDCSVLCCVVRAAS